MIILETNRLLLRQFKTTDASFILLLLNNPSWLQYIGDRKVRSIDDALEYLSNGPIKSYKENGFGLSLIEIKNGNIPIGMCGLIKRESLEYPDIGFALLPEFTGNGYAFEIASATKIYAKDKLGITNILAITSSNNIRSIALLNKINLEFEKMIKLSNSEEALMLFS